MALQSRNKILLKKSFVMISSMRFHASRFFRDKENKIVLWQYPNLLIWVWIILKLIIMVLSSSPLRSGFEQLSAAVLFAWAYLELTSGVNYFRRALGATVLAFVIVSFYK